MMELIELKSVRISILLLMMVVFYSCEEAFQDRTLECLLRSIKVDLEGMEIDVGQHDGWTDSTSLMLITYHRISSEVHISSDLKGTYKGKDIYFYQRTIDSLDKKKYKRIPHDIKWEKITPRRIEENYFPPPYDPINIQVKYNYERNCFEEVIGGKGYIDVKSISNCKCEC